MHYAQRDASGAWHKLEGVVVLGELDQSLLHALAAVRSVNQIAEGRGCSPKTIDAQIARLMCRLDVSSRRKLVIAAEQLYGIDPSVPDIDLALVTDRQLEVLRLLAEGLSYPEIGQAMGIQADTVFRHVEWIKAALNIASLPLLAAATRKVIAR